MLPPKIEHWLKQGKLPPRLLISGPNDLLGLGKNIAAQLLKEDIDRLSKGLNPDVKIVADDHTTLKIGDAQSPADNSVRGLVKWLYQTPISSHRVLILENLERTWREGMQGWLKVIEEPPARVQFIFTSRNLYQLPETILSRLTPVIITEPLSTNNLESEAPHFIACHDLIARFKIIETLDKNHADNPDDLMVFLRELITLGRYQTTLQPKLPLIFQTYLDIKRNVNRRLALEHLALSLEND